MMHIPTDIVEEIRSMADIFDVVSGYVSLKKKGQNFFGLCPFHTEKTPSFSVNTQKQIFHCFGCGEGGNSISFIMKIENLSFPEALKYLAKKYNIEIPETKERDAEEKAKLALYDVNRFAADFFKKHLTSDAGKEGRAYLKERQFTDEIVEEYELGFAPSSWDELIKAALKFGFSMEQLKAVGLVVPNKKGGYYDRFRDRLMFPIHNLSGLIAGFGGRIINEQPNSPKYINSPETPVYRKSKILYGLFQNRETIRKKEKSLLVEGYADVLGLAQTGIRNAVASSGTSLTTEQARLLLRYAPDCVILYDGDLAGANAALRGVDILLQEGLQVRVALLPEGSDPDSLVKEKGKSVVLALIGKSKELIDFKIEAYRSTKPLKTPQQLADLVNLLAGSVAEIKDDVIRNLYIQEIARKLKLSETVVFRAVARKKRFRRQPKESTPVYENKKNVSLRFQTEREIIEILMRFPQMLPPVYEHLNLDEIKFTEHRQLLSQIYEQYVNTGKINQQTVLDSVGDGDLQKFIVGAMVKEEELETRVLTKWANDCLRNIKVQNLREMIEQVRVSLKNEEEKKNTKMVVELSRKWTNLKKIMEEIKAKRFITDEIE